MEPWSKMSCFYYEPMLYPDTAVHGTCRVADGWRPGAKPLRGRICSVVGCLRSGCAPRILQISGLNDHLRPRSSQPGRLSRVCSRSTPLFRTILTGIGRSWRNALAWSRPVEAMRMPSWTRSIAWQISSSKPAGLQVDASGSSYSTCRSSWKLCPTARSTSCNTLAASRGRRRLACMARRGSHSVCRPSARLWGEPCGCSMASGAGRGRHLRGLPGADARAWAEAEPQRPGDCPGASDVNAALAARCFRML